MANDQFLRDYHMTDSELTMFTQHICDSITRDITQFGVYGVLAAAVTSLQAKCDAFEIFPTDDFIKEEYMSATLLKDTMIEEMRVIIRSMALRVELKWGKSHPKYTNLGITDLTKISDESFITRALMIHAFMTAHLTDLTAEGLTQLLLDDMEDKIQALDDAKRDQIDKLSYRAEKAAERVVKGNEIYNLVSRYCEIGKRIWDGINPAFYNDYVIYQVSAGSLTPPQGLRFWFPTKKFIWEMVQNASSYQLLASTDGIEFFEIYAGPDLEFVYIPIQNGYMWYKCRGRNQNGYGNFSETLQQGYYDILPAPQSLAVEMVTGSTDTIHLTWGEVASATKYKVSRSSVDIGSPAGTFVYVGEVDTNSYIGTVATNKRHYFHLTCENGNQWSPNSVNIYIDVQTAP